MKINIPRMLLHLRQKSAESPSPDEKTGTAAAGFAAAAYTRVMERPSRLAGARKLGRLCLSVMAGLPFFPVSKGRNGIRKAGLPLLSRWTRSRDLPEPPPKAFRDIWREELSGKDGGR